MRWQLASAAPNRVDRLTQELGLPPLVGHLLVVRGITEPEAAHRFLHPSLNHLHDPFLMTDMGVAVGRLRRAIERHERILIYGDYDVDGTTAVVVLRQALESLGAEFDVHIPHRLKDGYGMRSPVVERAAAEGFKVLLSVDTGIREHEVVLQAQRLGIDCIITDHHLPEDALPPACAILNPQRLDCSYPDKNLSGVGVAFKLVQGLLGSGMSDELLQSYLKVVAIGTIADVVPLVGENRVIASFGLEGLRRPVQSGLAALLEGAGLAGRAVKASDVAFRIAPRLNAAGRMEDARSVIELLSTPEAARAREIASHLEELNAQRQRVEDCVLSDIEQRIKLCPERSQRYSLVFAGEGWHRGVLGIVAQRVVDRYYRPALIIGVAGGVGQGSGRSIPNFHLLNALTASQDLLERFGGHASAAGFTLSSKLIDELEARFEAYARSTLSSQDLDPLLRVDAEIDFAQVDWPVYEQLRRMEPFGMGNPTPVFAVRNLRLALPPRVVAAKHLKLRVGKGSKEVDAVGWHKGQQAKFLASHDPLDLAFTLGENFYQGMASLQMTIKDLRLNRM